MGTVILLRHGRTTANVQGILAGRTSGVRLDAVGREQAARAAARLAAAPVVGVVSSPLERCRQTSRYVLDALASAGDLASAGALTAGATSPPESARAAGAGFPSAGPVIERGITECDYGEWQGRRLAELSKEPLWALVQGQPSAVVFPGGESLAGMQARAVAAIRRHDAAFEAEYGPGAVWVAVSHGDIIKSILADALGMHLDLFQRISVGPASVSIVRYGAHRPEVVTTNSDSGDLSWLRPAPSADEATVGGGAGHQPVTTTPSTT